MIIFDFETSGLDPEKDRVIEMAMIHVEGGKVISEFSTIVKQDVILEPRIIELTGITQDMMENGMDENVAFWNMDHLISGDRLLVAHNAAFDLAFLHFSLLRVMQTSFNNPFIDTLTISRERYTYPHKLTDMCDKLGIKIEGAHRALNDVHACWHLFEALEKEGPLDDFYNKLGYLKKYGAPKWAPNYARLEETENRYEPKKYSKWS